MPKTSTTRTGTTRGRSSRRRTRLHRWIDDTCRRCGLGRREVWILDDDGHPVMALVWSDDDGDQRVQPFPRMLGLVPPLPPMHTRHQRFGDLPVGPEPPCPEKKKAEAAG